jgi:hypothetical protein
VAFGYRSARTGSALPGLTPHSSALHSSALHSSALHRAVLADWATGAALGVVSLATLVAWVVAWRRRLRADGVVVPSSRRHARREARARRRQDRDGVRAADVAEPVHEEPVHEEPVHAEPVYVEAVPQPRPGGLAAMESVLAGAELLMVACGEEETW